MNAKEFGSRVYAERKRMDLTQDDLANALHITKSTICRYEQGVVSNVKMPIVDALADRLNVNTAWLLEGVEPKQRRPEPLDDDDENIRILSKATKKMTPEQKRKLLEVAKVLFSESFDK